jgi:hypothetical protein
MYVRPKAYAGEGLKNANRRRIAVKESKDLVSWTHERTVLVPNEGEPADFYGLTVFRRGDLFLGFLQIYDVGVSDSVSSELVWSPNGYDWNRLPKGTNNTILELGKADAWDSNQIYVAEKSVMVDDEMWFYYAGNAAIHNVQGKSAVGVAKTKIDRLFGARSIKGEIGRILTRPFEVSGDLYLNVEMNGSLSVEVHSAEDDEPLEGYAATDCVLLKENGLSTPVRWRDKSLKDLKGKKIELENAVLYTFDIY